MKNLSAILWLFAANTTSGVAQGISMLAIPWYFAQQKETQKFAIIYLLVNLVAMFWGPVSGTIVDKYNRKKLALIISLVVGCLIGGIAFIGYHWGVLPWYMVALVFAITFFNYNIHYPNLYAFVQEISEPKYYNKISSYIEIQGQFTTMMAGAVGAMMLEGAPKGILNLVGLRIHLPFTIQKWEIHEIFLLDASTYLLAFFLLMMIRFEPLKVRQPESGSILERFKTGFSYLRENAALLIFGIASYSIFVATLISGFYLGAIYVSNHLEAGGDVYASMEVTYALGALLAGMGVNWLFQRISTINAIIFMTAVTAGLCFVIAFTKSIGIFLAMSLIFGFTNAGTRVQRITYLFKHIPNQVYGRAGSIFFLSNVSFRILFLLVFWLSFFHESNNVIYGYFLFGVFLVLSALVLVGVRKKLPK